MASQSTYSTPAVERPTLEQLQDVAKKHNFHLSSNELEQYRDVISQMLGSFDRVSKLTESTLPSNFATNVGCQPLPAFNPYNAWARITNITGSENGKLAGKKIAIKDNVHIAGVPLTNGSNFMRGFVSPYNATVVSRILDEGGVIKGKATCENLCCSGSSFSSASGPVLNPYDISRAAGGSSSGCAVLVAVGEVEMAVGTDQGGSVRLPSCWCGIVGLKPTHGLVPYTGIIPLAGILDHCGPMTRTVRDCALLLEVMAGCDGFDPRQPTSLTVPKYSEHLTGNVTGLRVGLLKEGFEDCEADVDQIVRAAAMSMQTLGVSVAEVSFPHHVHAFDVANMIFLEGFYDTYHHYGLTGLDTRGFKDTATQDFFHSAVLSHADNLPPSCKVALLLSGYTQENYGCHFQAKAINVLRDIRAAYDDLFRKYDVIIMPTIKFKAHPLLNQGANASDYIAKALSNTKNTFPYNATGHPALTINAGFSTSEPRLPIGMMIVGRHFEEVTVLRLAHAFEQMRDSWSAYINTEAQLMSAFQSLKV